jgi:hypothetical protein
VAKVVGCIGRTTTSEGGHGLAYVPRRRGARLADAGRGSTRGRGSEADIFYQDTEREVPVFGNLD